MGLDAAYLSMVVNEIRQCAQDAKIEKIYQPEKDEIVLVLRSPKGQYKLVMSAGSGSPRIHFTQKSSENPASPPMFCMLLRKHFNNARLIDVVQPDFERIIELHFKSYNELGDQVLKIIIAEIMGRHSNIIVCEQFEDGTRYILDSIKHIDAGMSSVRQILPGLDYVYPPQQEGKRDIRSANLSELRESLSAAKSGNRLDKTLSEIYRGLSSVAYRELSYLACKQTDIICENLTNEMIERLMFYIERVKSMLVDGAKPVIVLNAETKEPLEFSFMDITHYGTMAVQIQEETFSAVLDRYYSEKAKMEHIKQRSQDILKTISNAADRIKRKIFEQTRELAECSRKDEFRALGDLVTSNIYRLKRGDESLVTENYYEDDAPEITIELEKTLTPSQNAQKYYKRYNKLKNAEKILAEQIELNKTELEYLDTVFDSLIKAENEREMNEIREELIAQGYIRKRRDSSKQKQKQQSTKPMKFITPSGSVILCGKNNIQNDALTMKNSAKTDMWFHVKDMPGSHVVLLTGSKPAEQDFVIAAEIAAFYSKAKNSQKIPVDYTAVKNVKKPSGAKPGYVIYDNQSTAFVTPDKDKLESMRQV